MSAHRSPAPLAVAMALFASVVPPLAGQSAVPRVATAIRPDSIRVGEPFTLVLSVTLPEPGEVTFPAVLDLPDALEQRQPVQIRSGQDGTDWHASYMLSAWTAETHRIPPVEATLEAHESGPEPLTLSPAEIEVRSVLPADADDFELRESRGFLRVRTFPWWILAILGGLAALAWWWWRRRGPSLAVAAPSGPGDRALRELERLRRSWSTGELGAPQFYDRFEGVVREYVRSTRPWSPGRTLVHLGSGTGRLFRTLQRSLIVRFARVSESTAGPETAIDAGEEFVRAEMAEMNDADRSVSEPERGTIE